MRALPRLVTARVCLSESAAGPGVPNPFSKPARSMSQAALVFRRPSGSARPEGGGAVAEPVVDPVGQGVHVPGRQDRVGEERAAAPRVVVGGIEHHAAPAPLLQDGRAGVGERDPGAELDPERPGQIRIPDRFGEVGDPQLEQHVEHHEPRRVALEPRVPVGEPAVGPEERAHLAGAAVPDAYLGDRLGDLLAVGADVLDRRRPGRAGDARERLDPRPALGRRRGRPRRPTARPRRRARWPRRTGRRTRPVCRSSPPAPRCRGSPRRRPRGWTRRRHEQRLVGVVDLVDRVDELVGRGDPDQPVGRPADPHRRQRREVDSVLFTHPGGPRPVSRAGRPRARGRAPCRRC